MKRLVFVRREHAQKRRGETKGSFCATAKPRIGEDKPWPRKGGVEDMKTKKRTVSPRKYAFVATDDVKFSV